MSLKFGDKVKVLVNLLGPGNRKIFKDSIRTVSRVLHNRENNISLEGLPYEYTFSESNFELVEDFKVETETMDINTKAVWISSISALNMIIAITMGPLAIFSLVLSIMPIKSILRMK